MLKPPGQAQTRLRHIQPRLTSFPAPSVRCQTFHGCSGAIAFASSGLGTQRDSRGARSWRRPCGSVQRPGENFSARVCRPFPVAPGVHSHRLASREPDAQILHPLSPYQTRVGSEPPGVAVRSLNLSLSEVLPDDDATRWSVNPLPKKSAFSGPQLSTVHLLGAAGVDRRRTGRCRVLVQVRTARLAVCSPGCPHPPKARSARTAVGRRDWGEGGAHSFVSSRPRSEPRQAACEPSMQV